MPNLKAVSFQAAVQDRYYNFITPVNEAVVGNLTPLSAYTLVPWLFRAVRLRAQGVSRMPFTLERGETDVTDAPEFASLISGMKRRLFLTEASKCLTGSAYWLKETNVYGLNLTPRFVIPGSITPYGNERDGLLYFSRSSGQVTRLEKHQVVYFWNENFTCEYLPGLGEANVALAAASMLYALDAFTAQFFNQGAVKVTVFPVPTGTQQEEVDRLQNFLRRRLTSVRNAFRMLVMRASDKLSPVVIGSDIKDTEAPELTALQRDNVAAALGVPASVIDGRSSDDSNSRSEKTAFVTDTLIPECEFIAEVANEQLFAPYGIKLVFHPERLDIMQSIQLDQITAVATAVGGPVLTQDEGRDLLGYGPLNTPAPVASTPAPKPRRVSFPTPDPASETNLTKALTDWRKATLTALKSATDLPAVPPAVPAELALAIQADLDTSRTAADVRETFERHWPRPVASPAATNHAAIKMLAAEIALARQALSEPPLTVQVNLPAQSITNQLPVAAAPTVNVLPDPALAEQLQTLFGNLTLPPAVVQVTTPAPTVSVENIVPVPSVTITNPPPASRNVALNVQRDDLGNIVGVTGLSQERAA